jgi:hypothetical protein
MTHHRLDRHAAVYYPGVDRESARAALRWELERAGRIAKVRGAHFVENRVNRKVAADLLARLKDIRAAVKPFVNADPAVLAGELAAVITDSPVAHLVRMLEDMQSLDAWAADFIAKFEINPAPSGKLKPVPRAFVALLAAFHEERIGTPPGGGRRGPFVEFVADACAELNLPLADDVGQAVERALQYRNSRAK